MSILRVEWNDGRVETLPFRPGPDANLVVGTGRAMVGPIALGRPDEPVQVRVQVCGMEIPLITIENR